MGTSDIEAQNGGPNTSASAVPDPRALVLAVLDFEIDQHRKDQQHPGWTNWALLGGLGAILWLLVAQVGDVPARFSITAIGTAAILFVLDALAGLNIIVTPKPRDYTEDYRFATMSSRAAPVRPTLCLAIVRYVVLLIVLAFLFVRSTLPLWVLLPTAAVSLTIAVFIGLVIAKTFSAQIMRTGLEFSDFATRLKAAYCGIFIALSACAVILGTFLTGSAAMTFVEFKLAVLASAACFIVGLLVGNLRHRGAISTLLSLRRGLAFGMLDPAFVFNETIAQVLGSNTFDLASKELAPVMASLAEQDRILSVVAESLASIFELYKEKQSLSVQEKLVLRSVLNSAQMQFVLYDQQGVQTKQTHGVFQATMDQAKKLGAPPGIALLKEHEAIEFDKRVSAKYANLKSLSRTLNDQFKPFTD